MANGTVASVYLLCILYSRIITVWLDVIAVFGCQLTLLHQVVPLFKVCFPDTRQSVINGFYLVNLRLGQHILPYSGLSPIVPRTASTLHVVALCEYLSTFQLTSLLGLLYLVV
jgi:hypothetical protein